MINWAKKVVDELNGSGASPEQLSTAVIAICCMALLFGVLLISAVVYFDG